MTNLAKLNQLTAEKINSLFEQARNNFWHWWRLPRLTHLTDNNVYSSLLVFFQNDNYDVDVKWPIVEGLFSEIPYDYSGDSEHVFRERELKPIVAALLVKVAYPDYCFEMGESALSAAVKQDDVELTIRVRVYQPNWQSWERVKKSPLYYVVAYRSEKIIHHFFNTPESFCWLWSAANFSTAISHDLAYWSAKADNAGFKGENFLNRVDNNGQTMLHILAIKSHHCALLRLLKVGADPSIQDGEKHNFLMRLMALQCWWVVEEVISGSYLDKIKDKYFYGITVLTALKKNVPVPILRALLTRARELNLAGRFCHENILNVYRYLTGQHALHKEVREGDLLKVKLLLEFGANPNLFNNCYQTPLTLAVMLKQEAIITAILDMRYPFSYEAAQAALLDTLWENKIALFQKIFARLQQQDLFQEYPQLINTRYADSKNTLLHIATRQNNAELIQQLLNAGADPTLLNKDGESPLAVAIHQQSPLIDIINNHPRHRFDEKSAASALAAAAAQKEPLLLTILFDKMKELAINSPILTHFEQCLSATRISNTSMLGGLGCDNPSREGVREKIESKYFSL